MQINNIFFKQLYIQFLFNLIIVFIISKTYTNYIENDNDLMAKIYFFTTTFSHFFLLAALPLILIVLFYFIFKSKKISTLLFSLLNVLLLITLKVDSNIFNQFRYHLSPIVFSLLLGKRAGDIFQFSTGNIITAIVFIVLLILAQILFYFLAKKIISKEIKIYFKKTIVIFFICLTYSHVLFAWSDVNYYRPITQYKNVYPIFYPLTSENLMVKLDLVDKELIEKNKKISQNNTQNVIKYPLNKIISNPQKVKKNIIFIVIDSWRFDCLTQEITPNIKKFSNDSQVFLNHNSGSNMTTGGIFSLFYGIPATYFESFTGIEQSPVFMDEMLKQNYNISVFSSSTIENPPFNQNVFSKIKNLRLFSKGETPAERDQNVTFDWINNLNKIDKSNPFFNFIFYDAAHGFDFPKSYKIPFKPCLDEVDFLALDDDYDVQPFKNRYKNALHFIDSEIEKVISKLRNENLLDKTIVIITGDHGQEFNDNKKGYWQHAGNFSKYQIQVPMLIYDASKLPKKYNHQTLHYDVIPTLMSEYLGVTNSFKDYSLGQNIYLKSSRDWFVCGYNQKYSVIEKTKITNIYSSGLFEITDLNLNPLNEDLNFEVIERAFINTNKFYIKKK